MIRSKTILLGFALASFARLSPAAISDCIDATCRITTPNGSRGSGCTFEINQGFVYVLTAAHVVGNAAAVQCEFWRHGHQSQPLAGRVLARSEAADAAIVAVPVAALGGVLPSVVPLAPREYLVRPADTLVSVGCAAGAWSTGWKGHALGYEGGELRFLPTPANGRSGSAIFDAEGRSIVALVRARTASGGQSEGIATPVQAIYAAFAGSPSRTPAAPIPEAAPAEQTQCGPGGCPVRPQTWQNHVLPYRYRHEQQGQQDNGGPRGQGPWPSLPSEAAPPRPAVDLMPLNDKLGRIAALLEELKTGKTTAPAPGTQDPGKATVPQAVDEQARKAAEVALGQVAEVRAETAKHGEVVVGLIGTVEKIKQSVAEDGTISQRFHARVERVRTELEEKLGREASDREVRIGYVKDLVHEKVADGGLVGLAKAAGLPIGMVLVVWLVTRDIKQKRESGDPLAIEKLAHLIGGGFSAVHGRIDAIKDRLIPGSGSGETPKTGA